VVRRRSWSSMYVPQLVVRPPPASSLIHCE
jgi:hypothetical protein